MRFLRPLVLFALLLLPVSCGAPDQQLTQTSSGTWLSPEVQGEKQVVLSTTVLEKGESVMNATVMDVTTNFLPKGEILVRPDATEMQIVRVGLTIANTGVTPLSFAYDAFTLSLKNGTQGRISFYINQDNAQDFLQNATLQPGESTEGAIYYELPAAAVRADMVLEYATEEKTYSLPLIK